MSRQGKQLEPFVLVTFVAQDQPPRSVAPTPSSETCPVNPRLLVIGGGGHLGENRLQPALWHMEAGIADCLEKSVPEH